MPSNSAPLARTYLEQQLLGKSPEELVLAAFELGIKGCRRQDRVLVRDVLTELIAALDFNQPVAGGFLVLYDYALREVRENRFVETERILSGLREAWSQALTVRASGAAPRVGQSPEIAAAA